MLADIMQELQVRSHSGHRRSLADHYPAAGTSAAPVVGLSRLHNIYG